MQRPEFIPDETEEQSEPITYFEDARSEDGWAGQSTEKSYERLKGEILNEIERVKGRVKKWSRGHFVIDGLYRSAIEIVYEIAGPGGTFEGRFTVAALPRREPYGGNKSHSLYRETWEEWHEQSLRMAMLNVVRALEAGRILGKLSPGFHVLIPMMLGPDGRTVAEIWSEGLGVKALPSPEDDDVIDGEAREVEDA